MPGESLYYEYLHRDQYESERLVNLTNISPTTFEASSSIAAGQQATYLLRLPLFFDQKYVHFRTLDEELEINIKFRTLGCDAPADIRIKKLELCSRGQKLTPQHEQLEIKRKKKISQKYRHLECFEFEKNEDLVANNSYNVKLNSIRGLVSHLVVTITPNPQTYANLFNFEQVTDYQIMDEQNKIVGIRIDQPYKQLVDQNLAGKLIQTKPGIIFIPMATAVAQAKQGMQSGFYQFTGEESIQFTTSSGLASGNYKIKVYAYKYMVSEISNGKLYALRS